MREPRFAVGQKVRMHGKLIAKNIDRYVITQAMPYDGQAYEYRIKAEEEQFYRVAKEYELDDDTPTMAAQAKNG
jgi:hypothetical protein